MKTVRRQVLIREKDYKEKLGPEAKNLYDRCTWEPLSRKLMDQENMWAGLKGEPPKWSLTTGWLFNFRSFRTSMTLYNERYNQWRVEAHDDEMWITPSNHNGKPSRLGIATLEKDK